MDQKLEFHNLLSALVVTAMANNQTLTKEEIDRELEQIHIPASSFPDIYQYLQTQGIQISGLSSVAGQILDVSGNLPEDLDLSKEAEEFLALYKQEVADLPKLSLKERTALVEQYQANPQDPSLRSQITQQHLSLVLEAAAHSGIQEIPLGDLIQEGNLGLLCALNTFPWDCDLQGSSLYTAFLYHIQEQIQLAIQGASNLEHSAEQIGDHLADRANMLDHASRELASKLERQPSLQELAKFVSLPEDEVSNILKYSIDAMTIHVDLDDDPPQK